MRSHSNRECGGVGAEALEPGVTINHVLQLGFQMKEKAGFMSSSLLGKGGKNSCNRSMASCSASFSPGVLRPAPCLPLPFSNPSDILLTLQCVMPYGAWNRTYTSDSERDKHQGTHALGAAVPCKDLCFVS